MCSKCPTVYIPSFKTRRFYRMVVGGSVCAIMDSHVFVIGKFNFYVGIRASVKWMNVLKLTVLCKFLWISHQSVYGKLYIGKFIYAKILTRWWHFRLYRLISNRTLNTGWYEVRYIKFCIYRDRYVFRWDTLNISLELWLYLYAPNTFCYFAVIFDTGLMFSFKCCVYFFNLRFKVCLQLIIA